MRDFFNFIVIRIKKYYLPIIIFLTLLGFIAVFDKALALGLILLAFLMFFTFFVLSNLGLKNKTLFLLLLIVLIIHLGASLFIYYANFQPFSGGIGDYRGYHKVAVEISQRLRQGNFSLEELDINHYYPVIIGYIYTLTLPEMLIGQLFGVWLAALSALFVYLIVQEIGGTKKWAFLIGLLTAIYPSYLFYGSLLLKDTCVIPLALAGLLFTLKLIKNFSWRNFLIFYIILTCSIHLRFYIGYAILFSFIICWLLISNLNLRKRILYAIIIIPLLGFLPEISAGQGYYGIDSFRHFLSPKTITFYREIVYNPVVQAPPSAETPSSAEAPPSTEVPPSTETPPTGMGSSFEMDVGFSGPLKFLKNSLKSFFYTLLGPFPWQMKYPRHFFALIETIPWYFLFFFIVKGIIVSIRRRCKIVLPLILFSLMALGAIALFINNFGIITRIRIPSFIALLCLIPLGFNLDKFNKNNKIIKMLR